MERFVADERTGLKYEPVGDYYLIAGDSISLDYTTTNDVGDERPWLDDIPDAFAEVDGKAEETELHDALHLLLSTLAPEEPAICKAIMADLSERASAASLNISQKAFVYRRDGG